MSNKIDLFLLSARRIALFKETIISFAQKNENSLDSINKVWILDDRSTWEERKEMSDLCFQLFGDNVFLVSFDSQREFAWIDKFNFIGKAAESDFVLLLEDDWRCLNNIKIKDHLLILNSFPNVTQIAFCDPLWIQDENIKKLYPAGSKYWNNPWPEPFKHINNRVENGWSFVTVRMRHYTNNPAITRTECFRKQKFLYESGFEHKFADGQRDPMQFFTTDLFFEHLGYNDALEKRK